MDRLGHPVSAPQKTDKGGSIFRPNRFGCREESSGNTQTMNAGDGAGGPSYPEAPSLQGFRTSPAPPTQANATLLCRPLSPGPRFGGSRDSERQSQAVSSKFAGRDVISVHPHDPFQKPGLISSNEEPEMRAEVRSLAAPQRS